MLMNYTHVHKYELWIVQAIKYTKSHGFQNECVFQKTVRNLSWKCTLSQCGPRFRDSTILVSGVAHKYGRLLITDKY